MDIDHTGSNRPFPDAPPPKAPGARRAGRITIAALLILLSSRARCVSSAMRELIPSRLPRSGRGAGVASTRRRRATVRELQRTIPLTGTIQPLNQTEIRSQQAAEIQEVLVREGEPVEKGQVLARLDTVDLEAKLRDKLGALDVGKAQLALARKNLEANESLLERNFISQTAFDNLQSSFHIGEATLVSLQAQVEQARKALAHAVIRSPIAGIIAERVAQPGLRCVIQTLHRTRSFPDGIEAWSRSRLPAVQVGRRPC